MSHLKLIPLFAACIFAGLMSCDGPSTESKVTEAAILTDTHNLNPAFWDYAVSSNMLQIELGRLASEKGTTEQVKELGRKAEQFHTEAVQQLKNLGSGHKTIQFPDSLGSADKTMVNEFSALEGSDFDTRYLNHVLISHKSQLDRYEEAIQKADSPKLKEWLTAMQNHMRKQLQEVDQADSTQTITAGI